MLLIVRPFRSGGFGSMGGWKKMFISYQPDVDVAGTSASVAATIVTIAKARVKTAAGFAAAAAAVASGHEWRFEL